MMEIGSHVPASTTEIPPSEAQEAATVKTFIVRAISKLTELLHTRPVGT